MWGSASEALPELVHLRIRAGCGPAGLGLAVDSGQVVAKILEGGSAEAEGLLRVGDAIISANGEAVSREAPLKHALARRAAAYDLVVQRRDAALLVNLEQLPLDSPVHNLAKRQKPIRLVRPTVHADERGLGLAVSKRNLVERVVPGGAADATKKFFVGDVIVEAEPPLQEESGHTLTVLRSDATAAAQLAAAAAAAAAGSAAGSAAARPPSSRHDGGAPSSPSFWAGEEGFRWSTMMLRAAGEDYALEPPPRGGGGSAAGAGRAELELEGVRVCDGRRVAARRGARGASAAISEEVSIWAAASPAGLAAHPNIVSFLGQQAGGRAAATRSTGWTLRFCGGRLATSVYFWSLLD